MYVIKRTEPTEQGEYLASINIGYTKEIKPIVWRFLPTRAIHFENKEEAQATITFIGAVLDWELEEQLEIVEVN